MTVAAIHILCDNKYYCRITYFTHLKFSHIRTQFGPTPSDMQGSIAPVLIYVDL